MPTTEDDLLPLSALQHLLFCERQCALIHIERAWADNRLTVEGSYLHERADSGARETRGNLHVARGLPLRSLGLGLSGKADVVEFHLVADQEGKGIHLPGLSGRWLPFPVDFKRGRPKRNDCDRVQLCAQALCLEEMLAVCIPRGALYYGKTRRRLDVVFDDRLRGTTVEAAARLHQLIRTGVTPWAVREPKCEQCSLIEICKPDALAHSAKSYLDAALRSR
ncbi:MAG TPA: CRISPR-associated protein Cas4 [Thermoanaerobaculia bacterium]|nr:CRISPR-associated protein Cas4 [Thermoanaerobaculia bacterium]